MEQEFLDWFDTKEVIFYQGQFYDKDIAYSAWLEGRNTMAEKLKEMTLYRDGLAEDYMTHMNQLAVRKVRMDRMITALETLQHMCKDIKDDSIQLFLSKVIEENKDNYE